MKKLSIVGLFILILTGCQKATQNSQTQPTTQTIQEAGSIMERAVAGSGAARCTVTNTTNGSVITYTVSGKKMKAEGISYDKSMTSGAMMSDGSFTYIWDTVSKKGMKMTIPTEEDVEKLKDQGQNVPDFSKEEVKKEYEDKGYTMDCKETRVSDSDFIPPTDVTFTDLSAMMEQSKKMMESSKTGKEPSQAEIDALIKQYQQGAPQQE